MHWFQNLCRLCGQISEVCYPIENAENPLVDDIKKHLHIECTEEDYKPNTICGQCLSKLKEFTQFFGACHNVNQKYETIYQASQKETSNKPTQYDRSNQRANENKMTQDVQGHRTAPVTIINPPNNWFKTTESSIQIQQLHLKQNMNEKECHMDMRKNRQTCKRCYKKNITKNKAQSGNLFCPLCAKKCSLVDFRPFHCYVCDKRYKTAMYLKKHLERHTAMEHETTKLKYNCDLCEKEFKYKYALVGHMRKHHICETNIDNHNALFGHIKFCTVLK